MTTPEVVLDYEPHPACPETLKGLIWKSKEGFPKTFLYMLSDEDKAAVATWLRALISEIVSERLALTADSVKTTKKAQPLISIRALAKEATDYPLSDGTELGEERAYLFFCQLMAKRPLGFNIPDFPEQVSHPPLDKSLKKVFCEQVLGEVETGLSALGAPEGMAWTVSVVAGEGQFVRGRRPGAVHDTFNATVPLAEQNYEVVIRLVRTAPSKGKPVAQKGKVVAPKGAQYASGGGGGSASSSPRKHGSAA